MSSENWLVMVGDETLQISLDDLRALILEGRIEATDLVKRGELNWIQARYAPGLRAAFADRHIGSSEVPLASASEPLFAGNHDSRSAFKIYLQSDDFPAMVTSIVNAKCQNHVDLTPSFICATCQTPYCRDCTKLIGSGAGSICALCGSLCLPYENLKQRILQLADRRSKLGWNDLGLALRYPWQEPLTLSITGVIYGACLVFLPYFAAPGYGYLLAGIGLLPALIANALMFGCMTLVINDIAAGRLKYKHAFDLVSLLAEPQEMFSLWTGIMVVTIGPLLLSWHFISNHPLILALAVCWMVCYYPLAVLVAADTQQFTATINPLTGLNAISRIKGNYWRLFLMYVGLVGLTSGIGCAILMVMFPHDLLKGLGMIWLPVVNLLIFLPLSIVLGLLIFYTNIVIAFLIGRTLFKAADEGIF